MQSVLVSRKSIADSIAYVLVGVKRDGNQNFCYVCP
jgi:hypothetical protein